MFRAYEALPLLDAAPTTPTSVQEHETKTGTPVSPSCSSPPTSLHDAVSFRHSGWERTRERILDALMNTAQSENRIKRFDSCGSMTWVYRNRTDPRQFKLVGGYCRDRFCTPCAVAKAHLIRDNIMVHIKDKRVIHLVLTLKTEGHDLTWQLDNFLRCFTLLRQTSLWRRCVAGGAAFIELKWNPGSNRWHPHLHILFEGRYLPHDQLSPLWSRITDGSYIVHLKEVPNEEALARDVAKYAGKGVTFSVISDPDRLEEAIIALNGRRVCMTFGCWRKFRLLATERDGDWEPMCSLDSVITRATGKDPAALEILRYLLGTRPNDIFADLLPGFQ